MTDPTPGLALDLAADLASSLTFIPGTGTAIVAERAVHAALDVAEGVPGQAGVSYPALLKLLAALDVLERLGALLPQDARRLRGQCEAMRLASGDRMFFTSPAALVPGGGLLDMNTDCGPILFGEEDD